MKILCDMIHQNKSTHEHVYRTTKDQKTKKVNIVLFLRRISFVLRKGDLSWLTLITCKWFEWSHVSFLFGYKREHVIRLDDPRKSHASYVCLRLQGMSPLLRSIIPLIRFATINYYIKILTNSVALAWLLRRGIYFYTSC